MQRRSSAEAAVSAPPRTSRRYRIGTVLGRTADIALGARHFVRVLVLWHNAAGGDGASSGGTHEWA